MNLIEELKLDASGVMLFKDWLGEGGKPVDTQLSQARANICETCTENVSPRWWEHAKLKVAEIIRTQLEFKQRAHIGVLNEESLHMCRACGCCAMLKVHVPIEHIKNHTSEATLKRFPPWCWILKELKR